MFPLGIDTKHPTIDTDELKLRQQECFEKLNSRRFPQYSQLKDTLSLNINLIHILLIL
jgi:hypothetical protein